MKSEGMAAWNYNGNTVIFKYLGGRVIVRFHPFGDEPPFLSKVKSIAIKLNARLLGDEQEEY
jgi:hypothetical protein